MNFKYETANPAKQMRESPVMRKGLSPLLINMEKMKPFTNLAFMPIKTCVPKRVEKSKHLEEYTNMMMIEHNNFKQS